MTPEGGKVIAGKYRLIRPLAEGGMGAVWVAEHTELQVEVALKFMLEGALHSEMGRQRFKREARAAAQLKSPHVTQIHDYGIHQETPYIAMELLEGESLNALLRREKMVSPARAMEIVEPLCRGLKLAHDAGIVHRDLKPSNIFLSRSGDHEVVKILDFGIAKEREPQLVVGDSTATGALVGSPSYMSPEQVLGEDIDQRSDLWSLGVLIYQLLTGLLPFRQRHLGQLMMAICDADVIPPSNVRHRLTDEFDAFVRKALARDREERFQDAAELAAALSTLAAADGPRPPGGPPEEQHDTEVQPHVVVGRHEVTRAIHSDTTMPMPPPAAELATTPGIPLSAPRPTPSANNSRLWLAAGLMAASALAGWALSSSDRSAADPVSELSAAPTSATAPPPDQASARGAPSSEASTSAPNTPETSTPEPVPTAPLSASPSHTPPTPRRPRAVPTSGSAAPPLASASSADTPAPDTQPDDLFGLDVREKKKAPGKSD